MFVFDTKSGPFSNPIDVDRFEFLYIGNESMSESVAGQYKQEMKERKRKGGKLSRASKANTFERDVCEYPTFCSLVICEYVNSCVYVVH